MIENSKIDKYIIPGISAILAATVLTCCSIKRTMTLVEESPVGYHIEQPAPQTNELVDWFEISEDILKSEIAKYIISVCEIDYNDPNVNVEKKEEGSTRTIKISGDEGKRIYSYDNEEHILTVITRDDLATNIFTINKTEEGGLKESLMWIIDRDDKSLNVLQTYQYDAEGNMTEKLVSRTFMTLDPYTNITLLSTLKEQQIITSTLESGAIIFPITKEQHDVLATLFDSFEIEEYLKRVFLIIDPNEKVVEERAANRALVKTV